MQEFQPNKRLDCRGLLCPLPIIKTSKAIQELKAGQILQMISTDAGSKPDMEAWVKTTRNELLKVEEKGGEFVFYVRKRG